MEKAMSLPRLTIWCGVSPRGIMGLHFVDRAEYLSMLEASTVPAIHQLRGDEIYDQHDGHPQHLHLDARACLGHNYPDIGQTDEGMLSSLYF
jgi:hypothetical protein